MLNLNDPVHRLIDMVVEEVSLVDRAANKHRFLIVKRDEAMAQQQQQSEQQQNEVVTKEMENTPLGAAVAALDGLTKIVELLGQLGADNLDSRVMELAAELRSVTEQLLARLTGAEESTSEGVEEKQNKDADAPVAGLAEHIEATKQALSQLQELVTKVPSPPPAQPIPASPPGEDGIAKLNESMRALSDMVKEQQQRISVVEKQHGLPNSAAPAERVSKATVEEVGWPLDLNNSKDRESVDKSVSFHDL